MDKKKILYIVIFLLVTVLLGWAIYTVFFAPDKPTPTGTDATISETDPSFFPDSGTSSGGNVVTDPTELPFTDTLPTDGNTIGSENGIGSGVFEETPRIQQVSTAPVISPSHASGGGAKFYNQEDGKFYTVDSFGNVVALSEKQFFNVENVNWSPKNNESIIEYPDGANIYFDFDTQRQVTLPAHWDDFSFSPQGDKVASKSISIAPENRWLISTNPDGSDIKLLEPMGNNQDKVIVDWSPNQQVVALSNTGQELGDDRIEILFVGQNKENFKSAIVEGRGLETQWSPEGKRLLHSVYNARNEFKPELWIVGAEGDGIGGNRRLLNVSTWAHKCTMTNERFAYCGVPDELEAGAGFVPQLADSVSDTLYKIDTFTGLKTEIPTDAFHTIDSIFPGDDGQTLYFTDTSKEGLFKVNL